MSDDRIPIKAVKVDVTNMEHNKGVPFHTEINVPEQCNEMLESFRPVIAAGRAVTPSVMLYRGDAPVLQVLCRQNNGSHEDLSRSLAEALFLWPAVQGETALLGFENTVFITGRGLTRCLVISTVTRAGIYAQVFPIEIKDDGEVIFEADVRVEGQAEPTEFKHMLAVFGFTRDAPVAAQIVIRWLSTLGHEVEMCGEWTAGNINARTAR